MVFVWVLPSAAVLQQPDRYGSAGLQVRAQAARGSLHVHRAAQRGRRQDAAPSAGGAAYYQRIAGCVRAAGTSAATGAADRLLPALGAGRTGQLGGCSPQAAPPE